MNNIYTTGVLRYRKRRATNRAEGRKDGKRKRVAVIHPTRSRGSATVVRIFGFQDRLGGFRISASSRNLALQCSVSGL